MDYAKRRDYLLDAVTALNLAAVERVAESTFDTYRRGGKIIACGNGGSAVDARHFTSEFTTYGRPAITLGSAEEVLALGNDYPDGFETVFARLLRAQGKEGDILYGISTSGKAKNVQAALQTAREMGIYAVGVVGNGPQSQEIVRRSDAVIQVPFDETSIVQEVYKHALHSIWFDVMQRLGVQIGGSDRWC